MQLFFVETLSFTAFLKVAWLDRDRSVGLSVIYYAEAHPVLTVVLAAFASLCRLELRHFDFRFAEVRDVHGTAVGLKIQHQEIRPMIAAMREDRGLRNLLKLHSDATRLESYILKQAAVPGYSDPTSLWRQLFFINITLWFQCRESGLAGDTPIVLLKAHPFASFIDSYASHRNIQTLRYVSFGQWVVWAFLTYSVGLIKSRLIRLYFWLLVKFASFRILSPFASPVFQKPSLGVEYYGSDNISDPRQFSELFFLHSGLLDTKRVYLTFNLPQAPLSLVLASQLKDKGIEPVVLNPRASGVNNNVFFLPALRPLDVASVMVSDPSRRWMMHQHKLYREQVAYWSELFLRSGSKLYLSWYKYSADHCAIADALRICGGAALIYQRAFEEFTANDTMVDADIVFGFSTLAAQVERASGSRIGHHVVVGYVGDFRFPLLADAAQRVRRVLQANGAQHIMAFFDENSDSDERWRHGHGPMRRQYTFLLERVLCDQWFGLILKPKVAYSLRKRLGPVAKLLEEAVASGRCHVLEQGRMQSNLYVPAMAALAADIAVHGNLHAGTAAVESALAGVPTLVVDEYGLKDSILYQPRKSRIVFTEWPELWEAVTDSFRKTNMASLGDWQEVLWSIDPFRDGCASQRMETYIVWLMQGFDQGLKREDVLFEAAERYSAQWGKDKVTTIG